MLINKAKASYKDCWWLEIMPPPLCYKSVFMKYKFVLLCQMFKQLRLLGRKLSVD